MKTILLVENDGHSRSALPQILNGFGYKVITEQSSNSALSLIQKGAAIDLVITEDCLPDIDGLELVASLKELAPAVPSIILTANGCVESYMKAINLGVFEYMNKPVSAKEMGRIIKAAFGWSDPLHLHRTALSGH